MMAKPISHYCRFSSILLLICGSFCVFNVFNKLGLVTDKLFSTILDKFVPECFYRGTIRAQAFWQGMKIQIPKNKDFTRRREGEKGSQRKTFASLPRRVGVRF